MTALWLSVVALIALALSLVLPPLFRSQPAAGTDSRVLARRVYADQLAELEHDLQAQAVNPQGRAQAVEELQRQLLEEADRPLAGRQRTVRPWMGWGVALALSTGLPAGALLLYQQVGNPRAAAVLAAGPSKPHEVATEQDMALVVSKLASRLQSQPDDLQGWVVLARSYEVLQRFDDAVAAYRQAIGRAPDEPQLLADYADAVATTRQGDLSGPAQAAIDKALAIDPQHPKALALAGMAAYQRGDAALARQHWETVRGLLPPDSEGARGVEANLARLGDPSPAAAKPGAPGAVAARVAGTVSIDPQLRERVSPQDTVFVLARAPSEGRMPVAVLRLQVKDLPARFVLDDSLAMTPDRPLSRFSPVSVEVRVSRSGQAAPQSGDLFGMPREAALGQDDVALVADQMRP